MSVGLYPIPMSFGRGHSAVGRLWCVSANLSCWKVQQPLISGEAGEVVVNGAEVRVIQIDGAVAEWLRCRFLYLWVAGSNLGGATWVTRNNLE